MKMIPDLNVLYVCRWFQDILCMVKPRDFLDVSSYLSHYDQKTIDTLVQSIKLKKPITIPSLYIDKYGQVTGHEGRHRATACIATGVVSMMTVLHVDDRCANFYKHPEFPDSVSIIRPEIHEINYTKPPEAALAKILYFQKNEISLDRIPRYISFNKDGYGMIDKNQLSKENRDRCVI